MHDKEFEKLFKGHFNSLCNIAYAMVSDKEAAKDIVQNVFLKLWNIRNNLKIQTSIKSYLNKAVINSSINYIKKELKFVKYEDITILSGNISNKSNYNEDSTSYKELNNKVKKVIDSLSPKCKVVFLMSRYYNMSNKEIAENTGTTLKAVEKQITKALKYLRTNLRPYIYSFIFLIVYGVGYLLFQLS